MSNENRIPPGQFLTEKIPVLHEGEIPHIELDSWRLNIFGLVEEEIEIDFETFKSLQKKLKTSDFHCVTHWSKLNVTWEGIPSTEVVKIARVKPEAKFVMIHSYGGYSTNLSMEDFLSDDVLFALKLEGKELSPEHGYPVRLVVPKLYAWKSAKWVKGIEFMEKNKPGYWESRGYHIRGEPWAEERFG